MATDRDWWDQTWNPVSGCKRKPLSPGCCNCIVLPFMNVHTHDVATVHTDVIELDAEGRPRWTGKLKADPDGHHKWTFPLDYPGAEHPKLGPDKPSLIFVAGIGDLFIDERSPKIIDRVVETIALSRHIGLFLSKYTGPKYLGQMAPYFLSKPPLTVKCWQENIWLGFSAERQTEFNGRWRDMRPLAEAGWFIFVSIAPMLGPVTLPPDFVALGGRTWVIVNGEEEFDPKRRRPMNANWARELRDQCREAGIPFFMRGMHTGAATPPDLIELREFPAWP